MRKLYLFGAVVLATVGAFLLHNQNTDDRLNTSLAEIPEPLRPNYQPPRTESGIAGYLEYITMIRANQVTGILDPRDVLAAREQAYALMRTGGHRLPTLEWESWGPNNIGGRTRAILVDRNNPKRIYAGGVSGGLWISDNAAESWYPYLDNDTLAGVGVGSLCQAANGDIYVGTGEPAYTGKVGQDSYTATFVGGGVWKSTDGGNTFVLLPATEPVSHNSAGHQWSAVGAMGAHPTDPNVIVAGTDRGVMVTEDGGDTWKSLASYGSNPAFLATFQAADIKVDENAIAHICCSGRYFRGNLNDFTFEHMSSLDPGDLPLNFSRLMVDFSEADPNYVYVVGCNSGGQTTGVYRSTDNGLSWTKISPPSTPDDFFNPTGQQGGYDMWVAANPADKDRIYICGQLNIWEWTATKGWYPISETSGSTGSNPYRVHADQHVITFHPTDPNIMYVGTDGGIYRSLNALAEHPDIPTWKAMNKGYQITQFFNVAGGLGGEALSGTQDNGTVLVDFTGNSFFEGRIVNGGDGGYAEISKTNPDALFATSQFGAMRRSASKGNSMGRYMDQNIDEDQNGRPDCDAPFVTPFRLYEELRPDTMNLFWYQNNASQVIGDTHFIIGSDTTHIDNIRKTFYGEGRILLGTDCGMWLGTNALDFSDNSTWYHISPNATPASMEIAPGGDIIYVGMSNGRLYRISGLLKANLVYVDSVFDLGASGVKTTLLQNFGQYISGVAVDKHDPGHVVVSLGNYGNSNFIYRSTVADTVSTAGSFVSIQGILPRMPCYDVVIDYYNPNHIIAGTELGIYSTENLGTGWTYQGNGIPACPIFGLRQEMFQDLGGDCYVLYAGTHGRGFYRSTTGVGAHCQVNVGMSPPDQPSINVALYPNPARIQAHMTFTLKESAPAQLVVYNMRGQTVHRRDLGKLAPGQHSAVVPTAAWPVGQYLVVVQFGTHRVLRKLVVG